MKIFLTKFSQIGALALFLTALAFSASAQVSLRNALDADGDHKADYSVFRFSNAVWYTLKSGGGGFSAQKFRYFQRRLSSAGRL